MECKGWELETDLEGAGGGRKVGCLLTALEDDALLVSVEEEDDDDDEGRGGTEWRDRGG